MAGNPFDDLIPRPGAVQNAPGVVDLSVPLPQGTTIVPGAAEQYPDIPSSLGSSARLPMPGTLVFGDDIRPAQGTISAAPAPRTPTSIFEKVGLPQVGAGLGGGYEALGKGLEHLAQGPTVPATVDQSEMFKSVPSRLGTVRPSGTGVADTGRAIADFGKGIREAQPPMAVPTYQDIKSIGDLGTYIWESVQQAAGSTVPMLAAGAVAGPPGVAGAGWTMGVGQMRRAVEQERDKARSAAVTAMQTGNNDEALRLSGIARRLDPETQAQLIYATGSVIGVLDSLFPASLFAKQGEAEIIKKMTADYVTKAVTAAAIRGMAKEGITESLQQAAEVVGIAKAKGAEAAAQYVKALNDNAVEIIDAGLRGGIGGASMAGMGQAGSISGDRNASPSTTQAQPAPDAPTIAPERQEPQLPWPVAQNVETTPVITPEAPAPESEVEKYKRYLNAVYGPPDAQATESASPESPPANPFADLVPVSQGEQRAAGEPATQPVPTGQPTGQETVTQEAVAGPDKSGNEIAPGIYATPTTSKIDDRTRYEITNANGDVIGNATVGETQGRFSVSDVRIAPQYQRQGVATALYDQIERDFGRKLQQDNSQTDASRAFWDERSGRQPSAPRPMQVVTPDGSMEIEAVPQVVELADLKRAEGAIQPRDRSRSEYAQEARERAANLDPARLQPSRTSDMGAPIVAGDGTILSGNGRTMSIEQAYRDPALAGVADAYRRSLGQAAQGMREPVLVMRAASLTPQQAVRFADLSNRTAIAQMSATERAMRDAQAMGLDGIALYEGGDFGAPQNQRFLRHFMGRAVTAAEMPSVSRNNELTMEGLARMRAAVLAAAYGDADVLSRMLESTDDNVRSITSGMLDAAPQMAHLRAGIASGEVDPGMDPVRSLMEAVKTISMLRSQKVSVQQWLAQSDAFGRDPVLDAWVKSFYYGGASATEAKRHQEKVASLLNDYAAEAVLHRPGGLFADETTTADVLDMARRKNDAVDTDQSAPTSTMGEAVPKGRAREGRRPDGAGGKRTAESDDILAAIQSAQTEREDVTEDQDDWQSAYWEDLANQGTSYEMQQDAAPNFKAGRPVAKTALEVQTDKLMTALAKRDRDLRAGGQSPADIAKVLTDEFGKKNGFTVTPEQIASGKVWWRIAEVMNLEFGNRINWTQNLVDQVQSLLKEDGGKLTYDQVAKRMSEALGRPVTRDHIENVIRNYNLKRNRHHFGRRPDSWVRELNRDLARLYLAGLPTSQITSAINSMHNTHYDQRAIGRRLAEQLRVSNSAPSIRQSSVGPDVRSIVEEGLSRGLTADEISTTLSSVTGREYSRSAVIGLADRMRQAKYRADLVEDLGLTDERQLYEDRMPPAVRQSAAEWAKKLGLAVPERTSTATNVRRTSKGRVGFSWLPREDGRNPRLRMAEMRNQGKSYTEIAEAINSEFGEEGGPRLSPIAIKNQWYLTTKAVLRSQGEEPMFAAGGWDWKTLKAWWEENPDVGREDATASGRDSQAGSGQASSQQSGTTEGRSNRNETASNGRADGVRQSFKVRDFLGRVVDAPPNAFGLRQQYLFLHPPKITWPFVDGAKVTLRNLDHGVPNWMAKAHVSEGEPGVWQVLSFKVRKAQAADGLTPEFLDALQSELGEIIPPDKMTPEAYKAWRAWEMQGSRWSQTSIDGYVEYRGDFYSPDFMREMQAAVADLATTSKSAEDRNKYRRQYNELSDLVDKLPPEDDILAAIQAYHGSPHDFDRFDLSKIGTGEGAQAYGHGLYFAEKEGTANWYKTKLDKSKGWDGEIAPHVDGVPVTDYDMIGALVWAKDNGFDYKKASAQLREAAQNEANRIKEIEGRNNSILSVIRGKDKGTDRLDTMKWAVDHYNRMASELDNLAASGKKVEYKVPSPGRMYEVNIKANPDDFLDWDKPLSQQSEKVKAAIKAIQPKRYNFLDDADPHPVRDMLEKIGSARLRPGQTSSEMMAEASNAFRDAGIVGIRYFDQGSRKFSVQNTYKGKPYGEPVTLPDWNSADRYAKEQREKGFGADIIEGTRNLVVFDDGIVEIVAKDGKPVTPQQRDDVLAAHAGTQSSPSLDLSPEARRERAEEMGFDTSEIAYRGLTRPYDGAKTNYYQMFTSNPWEASEYAMANPMGRPNVIASYIRKGRNLEIDAMGRPFNRVQVQHGKLPPDMRGKLDTVSSIDEIAHAARLVGYDTVTVRNVVDNATGEVIAAQKPAPSKVNSAELDAILAELGPIDLDTAPPQVDEGYTGVPPDKRGPVTVNVVFDPAKNVRSVNATFDPAQEASADLMAAVNASRPARDPRASALMMLKMGRPYVISDRVFNGIHEALQPSMGMVPDNVAVGVMSRIEPVKGDKNKARAIFVTQAMDEFAVTYTANELVGFRALFVPGLNAIGFIRYDLTGDIGNAAAVVNRGEVSNGVVSDGGLAQEPSAGLVAGLRGDLAHEITHYLRRSGSIPADIWSRVLAQANALSLLDSDYRTYLQQTNNPNYTTIQPGVTGREIYTRLYGKGPEFQERMDQEAVTHMVGLYSHGEMLPAELGDVAPILDSILDGSIWRGSQDGESSQGELELMGAAQGSGGLDMSPEARKARAEADGFDTSMVWYHGTKQPVEAFNLRKAGVSDPGLVGKAVYVTPSGEQAGQFATSQHYGRGELPNVMPLYLRLRNPAIVVDGRLPDGRMLTEAHPRGIQKDSAAALNKKLKAAGHDGVIFQTSDGDVTQAAVFDPKDVRSVNADFDPDRSGSSDLLAAAQKGKTRLAALHNLSAENLAFADRMGGIAAPSIAVVKEGMGVGEGFGEITLIGRKDLGDPSRNPVYDADAWSIRFPRPDYKAVTSSKAQKLMDALRPYGIKFADTGNAQETWDAMVNRPDPERAIRPMLRSEAAQAMFLDQVKGKTIEPVMRSATESMRNPWVMQPAFQAFLKQYGYDGNYSHGDPYYVAMSKAAKDATDDQIADDVAKIEDPEDRADRLELLTDSRSRNLFDPDSGLLNYGRASWIGDDIRKIGKKEIDPTKTRDRLQRALKPFEAEFKTWAENQIVPLYGEPRIKVNGRLEPYTLENITRVMTAPRSVQAQEDHMTFGEGKARAAAARKIDSLEEARNRSEWQMGTEAEIEEAREHAKKLMEEWRTAVVPYNKYVRANSGQSGAFGSTFEALDGSMRAMATAAKRGGISRDALRSALSREDFVGVPADVLELGVEAGKAFMSAPVPYFESKPQRSVKLNEFAGAVIPKKASAETKAILEKHGIPYQTYDSNKEGAKDKAAAKFAQDLARQGQDTLFAFAGINARTADKQALALAEKMEKEGTPREDIWRDTGWFRGVDGKWRFEIDDSGARYTHGDDRVTQYLGRRAGAQSSAAPAYEPGTLGAGFRHDDAYRAYPDTPGMALFHDGNSLDGARGVYEPSDPRRKWHTEGIGIAESTPDKRSTALHEYQHAIQEREDYGRGGNPDSMTGDIAQAKNTETELRQKMTTFQNRASDEAQYIMATASQGDPSAKAFADAAWAKWSEKLGEQSEDNPYGIDRQGAVSAELLDQDEIYQRLAMEYNRAFRVARDDPHARYRKLAGEAESRMVQARRDLTPDERRARPPWLDYDIPENEQIVRFGNTGPSHSFGTVQSPGADVQAYTNAVALAKRGASPEEIWNATGWFKDKTGKWRFEKEQPDGIQSVADSRTHVRRMEMTPEERKATPPWKEPGPSKPAQRASGGSVTVDRSFIDQALSVARRVKNH